MADTASKSGATARRTASLDPCTLGRPFHLLDDLLRRLTQLVGRQLEQRFNRRCEANFEAYRGTVAAYMSSVDAEGWRGYRDSIGVVHVRVDRRLLLAMLGYHYGDNGAIDLSAPETETELRFAATLHQQLLESLSLCVLACASGFAPHTQSAPRSGQRMIRLDVGEAALNLTGTIELALDEAWLVRLFDSVLPAAAPTPQSTLPLPPLRQRLPIRIDTRIACLEIPFDEVLRLTPGAVLPIRPLGAADVMVEEVRLFRARVAERNGLLCLTSFEPTE
jgi:flagellar motor switch protein FliM